MSMNCSILGLTPAQIDGLVATPALVTEVVLVAWDETRKAQLEASRATDNRDRVAKERQVRIAEGRERIARLHSPTEAKEFSRFLETQDLANLQARMSLEDMGHLYPRRLSEDDLDNLR